jgi:GDSL-like Lipase/Acylhydrolase family
METLAMARSFLALAALAWASPALACIQLPAGAPVDRPGSIAEQKHLVQETYIQERLALGGPYAIIALGDSIMGGWSEELLALKWGGPLLKGGRGGSTTLHWRQWLATWDWSGQSPTVVHLHIGRNDITLDVCPAAIAQSILALVTQIQAKWPGVRVVWQNIPPGGEYLRLRRQEIIEVNRLVLAQAATRGFQVWDAWPVVWNRCQDVRVCGIFLPGDKYRYGPIHIGPNGYALIARDAELLP